MRLAATAPSACIWAQKTTGLGGSFQDGPMHGDRTYFLLHILRVQLSVQLIFIIIILEIFCRGG